MSRAPCQKRGSKKASSRVELKPSGGEIRVETGHQKKNGTKSEEKKKNKLRRDPEVHRSTRTSPDATEWSATCRRLGRVTKD